jgi:hypothetical protein
MNVTLGRITEPPNQVEKTMKKTPQHTYSATFFRDECLDVRNPVIQIKTSDFTNIVKYNYCYIEDLKRYYYIDDISAENGIAIIKCRVDVLNSFKEDILNSIQYVLRQENINASPYLQDNLLPIRSDHNYIFEPFGDNVDDRTCGRMILATAGKGGTVI